MRFLLAAFLICNASATTITVAAASDLSRVAPVLGAAYQRASGVEVRFSFGSSGALLRQIENGAPYDVYLAANQGYAAEGVAKGVLRSASVRVYAAGRLALWSRSGKYRRLLDLRDPEIRHVAIANPAYAPYGVAAAEALRRAGVWDDLQSHGRLVFGENIRQTLQHAESGNADAAVVAWSHVFDSGGVLVPESLYTPVRQAGAVVRQTSKTVDGDRSLEFVTSAAGQAILRKFGFGPG